MKKVTIEKINYFGYDVTGSFEWNAKVLYKKNGKLHHCMIDVNYLVKDFFIPKNIQAKECKVLSGLYKALLGLNYFKL